MGNQDRARIPSDLAPILEFMRDTRRRLRELETPVTLPDFSGEAAVAIAALSAHLEEDIALVLAAIDSEAAARIAGDVAEATARGLAIEAARSKATGVTLSSPNGTKWVLGVSDAGATTWTQVV